MAHLLTSINPVQDNHLSNSTTRFRGWHGKQTKKQTNRKKIYIYISSSSSSFHYSGITAKLMSLAIICSFSVHAGYVALQHQPSNSPDSPGKAANVIPEERK